MLLYGGIVSLALGGLSRGAAGIPSFLTAFLVFILSAAAISNALLIVDRKTIANFRRTLAMLLAGEILWLAFAAVGAAYARVTGSPNPLTNMLFFGAFACAGFEFLVINGTFVRSTVLSLVLAVIHPASTLMVVRYAELAGRFDVIAAASGAAVLVLSVVFPFSMKKRKTSLGHDALGLFQAFMKTWAAGDSDELEGIIADHSEEVEVVTKVLRFSSAPGDFYFVLPGVHPGPFHPVGSYDLPGVVSRAFKEMGPVMVLHRPGGHERNLATRSDTAKYALEVKELALSITAGADRASLRGPLHAQIGKAAVSTSSFSEDMVMTISFAPRGSDDLDTRVEAELAKFASQAGFDLSVVDAHNSIDPNLESPLLDDPGWRQLFDTANKAKPEQFKVAYAHSSELRFAGRGDLTENGIGVFLIQSGGAKSALILADANNSVPSLREETAKALGPSGYELIEFCTSDSHNLAARGLTAERGYEALGEATPVASIVDAVVKLAKLADSRLSPAEYGSAKTRSKVRVFGAKALEEFAAMTQSSSKYARNYFKLAASAVAVFLLASLVF